MKLRSLLVACCALLSADSILAQPRGATADPVSGSWGSDGTTFLELKFDGKGAVSGTAIWRIGPSQESRAAIKTGTYDRKTGVLRLEGDAERPGDGAVVRYVIEGKIDKETATGTYAFGGDKGTFTFKKLAAQAIPKRTPEQMKASYDAHQGEFDYLLGDWEFTSVSKEFGKGRGYWSAVRLAEGAQILDEYRVVGDGGETYYASSTLRAYNAILDQWELVSAESGTGLQNVGTARRVGAEMHIEQKFGVMSANPSIWRIRYYDIRPDRFSWTADRSTDGGKKWETNHLQIEARRIGLPRSLGPLAPAKK